MCQHPALELFAPADALIFELCLLKHQAIVFFGVNENLLKTFCNHAMKQAALGVFARKANGQLLRDSRLSWPNRCDQQNASIGFQASIHLFQALEC